VEREAPHALGCIVREDVTEPSNFRNVQGFDAWMAQTGRIGISGVDTRALTRRIRMQGAPNAVIAHDPAGKFDLAALHDKARSWPGLEGMDLALTVTGQHRAWEGGAWRLGSGYDQESPLPFRGGEGGGASALSTTPNPSSEEEGLTKPHVVAIDYGAKDNIFRSLVKAGARVTVLPATASYDDIIKLEPAGVFLSNCPGDPAATGEYAVPVIRKLLDANMPIFGICLGHQMLALAAGAKTIKMHQGHRGANHPVKRTDDGRVEITSMNHGFAVDADTLPANARPTHISLFDGSLAGLELTDRPAFSVQYHPEASPGPQDSHYLFEKFVNSLR
jgi:carbamoyl-phosphate synthase small subunit